MNDSDEYRYSLGKHLKRLLDLDLNRGEKLLFMRLLSMNGIERFDKKHDVFVLYRESNNTALAHDMNVDPRSIYSYIDTLKKAGYIRKISGLSSPQKNYYLLLFGSIIFTDSTTRNNLIDKINTPEEIGLNGSLKNRYVLHNLTNELYKDSVKSFSIKNETHKNLARILCEYYRDCKASVFWEPSAAKLSEKILSSTSERTMTRLTTKFDLVIITQFPNSNEAIKILCDILIRRTNSKKASILIYKENIHDCMPHRYSSEFDINSASLKLLSVHRLFTEIIYD